MQGSIHERIRKNARDAQGKIRSNLKVYDVRYRYTDPQTGHTKQVQKRGFLRRADAEAFLLKLNQEQSEGTFLVPKSLLLRDYLTDWLESYAKVNVRDSTYEDYVRIVQKYILPALGNCDIKKISPVQIDSFYAHLMEHGRLDGTGGLSAKTVLYTHRVLNEALAHAVKRNLLVRNPANNLTNIPKPKKFKPTIYTLV